MQRNAVETIIGGAVLVVAVAFLGLAYNVSSSAGAATGGYELKASFEKVTGLSVGSEVFLAGVPVGQVVGTDIDTDFYLAEVTFMVREDLQLPSDTLAMIESESLLGGRILSLIPGGASDMLQPGGTVLYTQSILSLEELLGQVVHNFQGGN